MESGKASLYIIFIMLFAIGLLLSPIMLDPARDG